MMLRRTYLASYIITPTVEGQNVDFYEQILFTNFHKKVVSIAIYEGK